MAPTSKAQAAAPRPDEQAHPVLVVHCGAKRVPRLPHTALRSIQGNGELAMSMVLDTGCERFNYSLWWYNLAASILTAAGLGELIDVVEES